MITYRASTKEDVPVLAGLALELWPHRTIDYLTDEISHDMGETMQYILAYNGEVPIGFAQVGTRYENAVGFLEGIYVKPNYRRRGIGGALVTQCENWARGNGASVFDSDTGIDNQDSYNFHMSLGFKECGRIITFRKSLANQEE